MPVRIIKEICVVAITLIYSGLYFWWLSRAWDSAPPWWQSITLLLASLLWVALLAASLALITDALAASGLIVSIPLLIMIVGVQFTSAAGAGIILLMGLLYARWHINFSLNERLRYRIVPTFFTAARWLLVSLAAAAAGLAAPTVVDRLRTAVIVIPEQLVARVLEPASALVEEVAPGQEKSTAPAITALLNRYLTQTLPANPAMAAAAAFAAGLMAAHLVIPLLVWPVLAAIALFMLGARRFKLAYVVSYPAVSERLSLDKEPEEHV